MIKWLPCCFIALSLSVLFCLLYFYVEQRDDDARYSPSLPKEKIVILLWTSFFGQVDYLHFPDWGCQDNRCIFTSNRTQLSNSRAVVFHSADIKDIPSNRMSNQIWIWHNLESPLNTRSLIPFDGIFNWTATYRLDSDLPTPYGKFRNARPGEVVPLFKNYAANKTKMVVWMVSNCLTSSGRENYVRELNRHLPVDIFGRCGPLTCLPKMSPVCYQTVFENYFYYLSFENSYCRDYVTEKFFHALNYDIVPVVFGGARYSEFVPSSAYIDASSFSSPQHLAKFLTELAADPARYNTYFEWKNNYVKSEYHWSCELCRKLHSNPSYSVYHNLEDWWRKGGQCQKWENGQLRSFTN